MTTENIVDIIVLAKLDNGKIHHILTSRQNIQAITCMIGGIENGLKMLEHPIEGIDIIRTEMT